jgi:hypothetical protein
VPSSELTELTFRANSSLLILRELLEIDHTSIQLHTHLV